MNQVTLDRVPEHLRQFIVHQDYSAYDVIDQAVWRFVLLQTYQQLKNTAHPAYIKGLEQTGISIDHIPRIEEMDRCLAEYGWGAVCVDGFIPPRAFQEFQALGIMTIATEIRTADHLAYTPAPDIIHESAGHSPIVPDPTYRQYLQQFGQIGAKAFSSQEDIRVYQAIRDLSEIKEDPNATTTQIKAAEAELHASIDSVSYLTEAALMSRLHWWTVEYGLVGTPKDYKIYGAGLLSSVGESFFCHDPKVKKVPLSADCIHVSYDITEPQPQLFVARDFDHLNEVLDQVADQLAFRQGGLTGLEKFRMSGEVGTVELNSGVQVSGRLTDFALNDKLPSFLRFEGRCALARKDQHLPGQGPQRHPDGYSTPLGVLRDGRALSRCKEVDLRWLGCDGRSHELELDYRSGIHVKGRLENVIANSEGYLACLTLSNCTMRRGDEVLYKPEWGEFDIAIGEEIGSVYAGPADVTFHPKSEYSHRKVPQPKLANTQYSHLLELYQQALDVWDEGRGDPGVIVQEFTRIDRELSAYRDAWLLRWNLLEGLKKIDRGVLLASRIKDELLEIESRHYRDAPITMGLRFLGFLDPSGRPISS